VRRLLGVLVLVTLIAPSLAASAQNATEYRDDFGDGGYSGNDGDLEWGGPWVEFGDDGSPGSGLVHIGSESCSNNECLHMEGAGLLAASFGIRRSADLGDFAGAQLNFDIVTQVIDPVGLTHASLRVQVFDGAKWLTVTEYDLSTSFSGAKAIDVSAFANEKFALGFEVPGLLGGGEVALFEGDVAIDRVVLTGSMKTPEPTTTTSSSTTSTTSPTRRTTTTSTTSTSTTASNTASAQASVQSGSSAVAGDPTQTTTTTGEEPQRDQALVPPGGAPPAPPSGSGLRDPGVGLLVDYEEGMMGDMGVDEVEVLGVELTADYSMAVEAFEATHLWLAGLVLIITAAIVGGLDRGRSLSDAG
jgi:hypothetical protein